MTFAVVLLVLAVVLAVIAAVVETGHSVKLLAGAIVLLAFAVWLGVPTLDL